MIYYSYTPTSQQKNEIYQAQLALQIYRLRQAMSTGMKDANLKDFLIKPPGRKRRSQLWQSEEDMMMTLAMHAGTSPEEFYGNLEDSGDSIGST